MPTCVDLATIVDVHGLICNSFQTSYQAADNNNAKEVESLFLVQFTLYCSI